MDPATELILIRHAPAETGGRVCGRRDVPLRPGAASATAALRAALPEHAHRVTSPARRCRETAQALWPGAQVAADPRLWEQDFGDWEGLGGGDIPDLGPLPPAALAAHRPPGGESFEDVCARAQPALRDFGPGATIVVAHAGTVRAALALALGAGPALAMEVAPLSVTRLRLSGGAAAVICANCAA